MTRFFVVMLIAALAGSFSLPQDVLASDASHGGGNQLVDLGWRVLNFLIFAAILYFAAAKPIRGFLAGRIDDIRKELGDAEKSKEAAEKRLADHLKRVDNLEAEVKELCETLRREGEVERERIIEAAHEAADKIKAQAGFSAEQELNKAISLIKKETADAAVSLAEKILKKDIKKEDQKKLVSEYLESLGDVR